MGIRGSLLADQANQLEGEYALVLDSEKRVHSFLGPAGADTESADNWLELQVVQWRGQSPTLVLRLAAASSDVEFKEHLDESTDSVQFIFKLPAVYPGGRVALLRNIRELLDGATPHGIQEAIFSKKETSKFLASKKWAPQHEIDRRWTNAPKVYDCQVGWAQLSSQIFFRFRVGTGESALLVVEKDADEYKSATGRQQPPQQQLNFIQLITLPVRVWLCIQYRRPRTGDTSQGHEPQVDQPGAAIRDASPLDTEEGSSTGFSGELKKLIEATTQYVVNAAGVDKLDEGESVPGEQPDLDSQSPVQGVVSPSDGKTEEEKETSNAPLDNMAAENLTMVTKRRKRKNRRKKRKAPGQAAKEVHADAQPQQDQENDEQSAPTAGGAAGPVVANVDFIEDDLRSPVSASASFGTAWSSPPSRISTSSRGFQTPPPTPNDSFTGALDEEGVSEHRESGVRSASETTSLPGRSRQLSQEKVISSEITTCARRESNERRSPATATPAKTTTHPLEISPRSERESPYLTPALWKSEDGPDDTRAATAHVEARQQEVSPQEVPDITGQPLHPHAEPASGPATDDESPLKDKGKQRAGDITTLAETLQSLDISQESTAFAKDLSISGSATPRPASSQLLATIPESTEVQPLSAAAVSASHPQRNESLRAATTTTPRLPLKPVVPIGRRWGAPTVAVPPAITPGPSEMAVVPTGRARTGAPPTYAQPTTTRGFRAAVPAGCYQEGGLVSGANPATMPGPMMAAVPAGAHGGFAPFSTVAPRNGAHQQGPSQRYQATTPTVTFWQGNPAVSPYFFQGCAPQTPGGGAYQTPPTIPALAPTRAPGTSTDVVYQRKKPEAGKFFWDLTYHTFQCAMEGCEKRCNLWDCQTVICPFCGPFSRIRYCGKEHLQADVRNHWLYCGQASMQEPSKKDSVPLEIRVGPPAILCKHDWDTPERHRQAVFFSTSRREGDYFLFADWDDNIAAGVTMDSWEGRCSPRVIGIVRFDDPVEKDRFRRVLAVCLLKSVEVQPLVAYMFRLLRDKIRLKNHWTPELNAKFRRQIFWELGVSLDPTVIGERHACETEWNGLSPRHCRDPICVAERQYYSSSMWSHCFERLVHNEECNHWLLRANRTTHPTVSNVYGRTRGEGFDDVVEEERRLFSRGEGWDGAGTGPMEMEGPEVC